MKVTIALLLSLCSCAPADPWEPDQCVPPTPDLAVGSARWLADGVPTEARGAAHVGEVVVGDLVLRADLTPGCHALDGTDDGTGWAQYTRDGVTYSTDDERTGQLVLAVDGQHITGAFAFDTGAVVVTDGQFMMEVQP